MRDIEGIEDVVRKLRPHLPSLEPLFDAENRRYKELIAQNHDLIGRVLKCHLVIEYYLDRFLAERFSDQNLSEARLSFFQKASLLPSQGQATSFVRPGILRLNSIRNRFGHTLQPDLENEDLEPLSQVLRVVRPTATFAEPIDLIEAFTTVACTWLIVLPQPLKNVFADAFSSIRAEP